MKSPKLRSLPLGLILFFLCFSISPCLAQFGGGTGSVASPYLVATAQHLSNVRDYADAYFLQTGDIFLNVEPYNSGQGWLPIGNQTAPFTGSYDGNSFHIYGLYINQPEGKNLGLFGYTNSAVLKNIALNNVNISGKDYIGSLVGSVNGSFIQSCSCDGTITGASVTGGLVGALELSCHLEKCSADCVVSGQFSTGGLCGYSKGASEIFTSFSKGTVTGDNATGGLVGMQGNSTISQSFSTSAVQGNWGAGGLLGVNDTQSLVSYCYSIGFVTGNSNTGGLIGRNVVSQTLSSYWNLESSGQVTSAGGIGRTTDEMTYPYASNTYTDWDLTEIWQPDTEYFVNAGYPYLQWMYPCPPVSHLSYLIENYSVILQWSPPYVSSYTGFNIYKNGVLYTTVTDTFFIDTDVYHGEQYTYQVSVVYEGGESSLSEPVSFYVYFPPLPANCVFPLNGSTEMDILPLIQWSPDAHHNYPLPDGYLLEVWALSGTHVVDEDVGNVTSYQITNPLDYETEYYWNVTPYTFGEENTRLYAENVPNWYFTTQEQIVKPVNLTATIENWKNVQLNWNLDERSLQNFNIYRNGTLIGNSYYPFYYDENLSQGEYSYYVTALYETAESEPSNTAGVTIAYIYPPQNVYAALIDSVLQISWQPSVSGLEQGYALYRLQEGQENEPYLWEQIGYTTGEFNFYDSNWQNLPTGYYKWAIIAHYDYDNYSEPAFSNVIYKVVNLIPDDNFRMAINIALHHPSDYIPTIADLNGLTGTLYAGQRSIVSIEGAQYLTNLQLLDLRYNQIIDLSPLAGLINLHELDINHNQISDLSPLAGLTNMRYLYLHWNQISGLSPLVGLTNLKLLWLYNNQISDLSPLEGLTNLQELWLNDNQIGDLSPLVGLTYLQELWIHNNQISDLSPLEELINLLSLCLTNNQISDLSPLAGLANLQELWLNNNPLSNLSPLEGLTHLQLLHLDDNQISDLSPLAELINLQELYLSDNQISEISPLSGLTNLKKLNLCYNRISDLNPLVGLANLIYLYLYGNQISDLSPLAGLTNLQDLWLFINNPISYESMWLSRSWSLPWSTNEYNPLSPCYPVPNRNAVNVSTNCDLSWQGNYYYSQDVFYEVWLGFSPYNLSYIGSGNHISGTQYSFNVALQPNTQYYWRVKAIAPSDTIWSGMWNFTTGESYYQPIISVTPTSIYDELTTAETSQTEITIANNGTAPLIWNSNIVLSRAEQKTGTNAYLTKENNTTRELHPKIENTADNNIRYKDTDRDGISIMPEINLSPSFGTIEPNSSVICILNFIPGDSLGIYNYELQLSSNDPVSPLVTVPAEYVVTSPIAYIPDDNFRMVINGALGQPSDYQPTIADLNGLTGYLDADERNITSIEGAQYLTNLQELYLYYNQISDISPLAGLSNLQRLDFGCNQISDLSPLEGLTNLQFLWLNDNQISNLSPLTGLFNMQVLYLNHNQISDLSPLAWLTTLQYLNLSGNHISDLSPLEGLTNLQYLNLNGNQISNLSPLANLTNLYYLYLVYNHISDLSPLAGLTNLQSLYLQQNQISDISPLVELTNLRWLDINYNPISYESMLLSQSWSLPWSTNEYNPLSPCYPVPNRNAVNVSTNYDLSWQGNYYYSQDVSYEVWLGVNPYSLGYQGFVTQMVNVTEHLYSFTPMLEPLTQYYWRIKAIATTDTIWSGMWNFTTGIQEFAGGDGTETNPFQVATAEQLNNVRNHLTSYFIQIANIDLGVSPWNEGEGWVPIGNDSTYFAGNYNGNGYYISNLQINRSTTDYQGLFGFANSAKLINIKINNIAISGCNYVGGLVGKTINCYIADCSNQGIISASSCFAGGIIGLSWNDTTIEKCNYNGTVTGTYCGGITGQATHWCLIIDCYSTGIVSGDNALGGIAGINWGNVQRSFSSVTISASAIAGGIVGISYGNSSINDCFSKGIINGFSDIGGVAGFMDTYTSMSNCYSTSIVTGTNEVGGLIGGSATININNSYWNVDSSGQYASVVGESRTTADMVYPYSDSTYVNWDWDNIWAADLDHNINDGYPYLQWMAPEPLYYPPQHLTATEGNNSVFLSWQLPLTGNPESYSLWCLTPGEEADDSYWNLIATSITGLSYTDYSWFDLPAGSYKWAIKAVYNGENYSLPAFSNELTKVPALPYISIYPTSIYQELTTLDTCSVLINIHNSGNNYLDWNCQIITYRSDQITKTQKVNRDLNISITPSEGILEPGETAICLLEFIPGDTTGVYHYDLQVNSNDITNPVIQIPVDFVVTSTSTIAYIPDDNFRMAINEALGQPNDYQPTIADLQGITGSLDAAYRSISIIVGAQYLTNLQELYLYYNQISDLSPLAGLTNLQGINLGCNMISDLTPLAGLTNLRWLFLFSNYISNIVPLEGLYNLRNLQLHYNQIRDISPLSVLINIGGIALGSNQISDITPLTELTHLIGLELYNNQVDDIKSLSRLVNIQWLYLNGNQISDISPLAGLTNLRELYLSWNQISDISPLAGLYNLWSLDIYGNPISYESMLLSQSWSLPWSTNEYNSLSPCYPDPNRDAVNVSTSCDLSWQGNYDNSQDVSYEVWLGFRSSALSYIGCGTQVSGTQYSFNVAIQPDIKYYWRIKAVSSTEEIWSGMWSFITGEEFYQPIISVTPISIYEELTTAETSQTEITIANNGTAPLIWNSNIVLSRAEQKTGTNAYLTKENNTTRELHPKIENTADNNIRYKDTDRDGISIMPEINLSPSFGTIEPNSSVICILNFIPGDSLGIYNYELQLSSNDPVSPLVTVPAEYVVTNSITFIPDNNFRIAINEALGQPSDYQPTIVDLNGLTGTLYAYRRNISSIEGAQYLINLQELHLYWNQISDLSPLAGLNNLQVLKLGSNQINCLSPLGGLNNLKVLQLYNNQLSDLSPLAGLTHLQQLDLGDNQISNFSPLSGLINLQDLTLANNQISNLSPLEGLTNLLSLGLANNQISDIGPLAGLTNLQELWLYNNRINDLSSLEELTNMRGLYLNYNQINDLRPLAGLTNLQELSLYWNRISDVSPLSGLTHLVYLYLGNNPISYESMWLSRSWSLPWSSNEYNPLSPCYPVPNRNAVNVSTGSDLSWQGNYNDSQDVFYEVWLGISPDSVIYQGFVTQMVNVTEHLYSFAPMLEPLTQYYWRIKAVSSTEEIWSGMWSFTTGNYEAGNMSMLEPISVTVAINALQNQVRLSWQRRRNDESYYVYWSENPYAEFPEGWNGPVNVTETNYTDTLTDKCFYRVFAMPSIRGKTENKQNTKPRAIMPGRGE